MLFLAVLFVRLEGTNALFHSTFVHIGEKLHCEMRGRGIVASFNRDCAAFFGA
jgi:hypothetical protein